MRTYIFLFVVFLPLVSNTQTIGTFISVQPAAPTQVFQFPSSHAVQKLIQSGDPADGIGSMPDAPDYTGFVPLDNSSTVGQLSLNHELDQGEGKVTMFDLELDESNQLWELSNAENIDFSNFAGTSKDCSGGLSPWGTVVIGEEEITTDDVNADGYRDWGWLVELDPVTRSVIDKLWAVGNCLHENATFNSDQKTLYAGCDDLVKGFLYKFVADQPADLSSGTLYVLKRDGPNASTGHWIQIPNISEEERNDVLLASQEEEATNFAGIEGVMIGPNSKIYFASKGVGAIYRFNDDGATVSNFELWVGPSSTNYTIQYGNGSQSVAWGLGADNIGFDGEGNLWVFQDGDNNYIWMVKPNHTPANPQVQLFGISPIGAEPTGITFTPDYKYMFMSFLDAAGNNSAQVTDAAGNQFSYNRGTVLVMARAENLGVPLPLELAWFTAKSAQSGIDLNWEAARASGFSDFEVERSADGRHFQTIGRVQAPSATFDSRRFLFGDTGLNAGCYYYRLKMNDLDGKFAYSPIRSACIEDHVPEVEVLGNPVIAGQPFKIRFNHWKTRQPMDITISDAGGREISQSVSESCPDACTSDLAFPAADAGVYFLRCTDGSSTVVRKIVVH